MISSKGSISIFVLGFISKTTSPYICTKRRYESQAKRGLLVFFASPSTASSFIPRLRTVSIIPGIETRAPERTESRSGFVLSPNLAPKISSVFFTPASTSAFKSSIVFSSPSLFHSAQTSVVIVNPAGTGTPIRFISARFAPLPPRRFFISVLPSAFPFPKV